ncbi:MAG: alkaline phosphatase, partial [Dysgonamonadaceae bacterium]|nr:alkaline phosphatase [Dysgonamonadaceae bacterium]
MKKYFLLSFLLGITAFSVAQEKTIKNVILLIPDGTSLATVSAARWYQRYIHPEQTSLKIDPYICGTIFTYSSNAPIGDSAPTTSCYMTGYPSRAGFVATYPPADPKNDIFPMNVYEPYQPMITLMEAARMAQQKATGLVFTCEFPHATPADCSAHSYDREKYDRIIPQMVHNQLDVVIGGGVPWLVTKEDSTYFKYLKKNNYSVLTNDTSFQHDPANKMWALFGGKNGMDYELDRNPAKQPSLAEMTQVAINKLSQNPNGFVLMVEGSKVDWAAHANDAAAMFTEMIAFDKACGVALDFAERNGETLIVIVPDHGNSGFSIGSPKCGDYHHTTKDELFGPIS